MIFWDVNNGIARRSWARNSGAIKSIKRAMKHNKDLQVTLPELVDKNILDEIFDTDDSICNNYLKAYECS